MGLLTAERWLSLLWTDLAAEAQPTGPVRRIGVLDQQPSALELVRRDLGAVIEGVRGGSPPDQDVDIAVDLALETTAYLYAAGARHERWRHWAGLAALGLLLHRRLADACPYLVLAGERECVRDLRSRAGPSSASTPGTPVWRLAVGPPSPESLTERDDVDQAWRNLLVAVPVSDWSRVDHALTELGEFWMLESEGEWEFFAPRSAPNFQSDVCAAAAVARGKGYRAEGLSADLRRYLEPGLADGYPEPLYPSVSPFPETAAEPAGER